MYSLFFIETNDKAGHYGQTDYCVVKAKTKHEAIRKAGERYSGYKEEVLSRDVTYPNCEIVFDENGVSGVIREIW